MAQKNVVSNLVLKSFILNPTVYTMTPSIMLDRHYLSAMFAFVMIFHVVFISLRGRRLIHIQSLFNTIHLKLHNSKYSSIAWKQSYYP